MINFKVKLNLTKYYPINDIASIIRCPLRIEGKPIGIITDYNLDTDEASGYLFDTLSFNFNQDKSIHSIEIIKNEVINNAK